MPNKVTNLRIGMMRSGQNLQCVNSLVTKEWSLILHYKVGQNYRGRRCFRVYNFFCIFAKIGNFARIYFRVLEIIVYIWHNKSYSSLYTYFRGYFRNANYANICTALPI